MPFRCFHIRRVRLALGYRDTDPQYRSEWAEWGIWTKRASGFAEKLVDVLTNDQHPRVREWAAKALEADQAPEMPSVFIGAYNKEDDVLCKDGIVSALVPYSGAKEVIDFVATSLSACRDPLLTTALLDVFRRQFRLDSRDDISTLCTVMMMKPSKSVLLAIQDVMVTAFMSESERFFRRLNDSQQYLTVLDALRDTGMPLPYDLERYRSARIFGGVKSKVRYSLKTTRIEAVSKKIVRLAVAQVLHSGIYREQLLRKGICSVDPSQYKSVTRTMLDYIRRAGHAHCDLILFPELTLPYECRDKVIAEANNLGIGLAVGLEHRPLPDGMYENCGIVALPGNKFVTQRKYAPYVKGLIREPIGCTEERTIELITCSLGKVAYVICRDFLEAAPQLMEWLRQLEVDIVLISALTKRTDDFVHAAEMLVRHAYCVVAFANLSVYGHSFVVSPEVKAFSMGFRAPRCKKRLLTVECDVSTMRLLRSAYEADEVSTIEHYQGTYVSMLHRG